MPLLGRASPAKFKAVLDQKSWQPHKVPYGHHKWHTDTDYEIDLVKAQDVGLQLLPNIRLCCCSLLAECSARVVGHD